MYEGTVRLAFPQRLNSVLKKSEEQIPRGLKPARNDKFMGLDLRLGTV